MKAEQAKKLSTEALDRLSKALAQGKSEALTEYLKTVALFHDYSFGNIMLIAAQRPDATHVAGFRTWKKLGRYVKKGEKGIVIIAPMMIRPKDSDGDSSSDEAPQLRFRAVHVFDVSQTDGEPLPEPASVDGDPGEYADRLRSFVTSRGIELQEDELMGADGLSKGGTIVLQTGLAPAEAFSVLVHETAHELLHHNGEDRPAKVVRETEAEAVAFVVGEAVGLLNGTAAADYIQLYRGDAATLAASLDRIQKVATEIIAAISSDPSDDDCEAGEGD